MWQQAGRAGRREAESLAVLVAQDDPLDQYLAQHPEELFDRPAEDAVIDPTNPYVLGPHLRCAARELPLAPEDVGTFFGPQAEPLLEQLIVDGALARAHGRNRRTTWDARPRTARSTSAPGRGTCIGSCSAGPASCSARPTSTERSARCIPERCTCIRGSSSWSRS